MFNSQILDVAIGLAIMYLFQSILVSGISEALNIIFNSRGRILQRALQQALVYKDDTATLYTELYNSPFIRQYTRIKKYPAYIRAEDFTNSIITSLRTSPEEAALTMDAIRERIANFPAGDFRDLLHAKAVLAEDNMDTFKQSITEWFSTYMAQVSEWYKNRIKIVIASLAFIVTLLLNVDSFSIMNELWKNDKLRESTVSLAETAFKNRLDNLENETTLSDSTQLSNVVQSINGQYNMIFAFDFPITWEYAYHKTSPTVPIDQLTIFQKLWWTAQQLSLEKIIGFLITTAAVTMGTPIWFDILKKLLSAKNESKENA